MGLFALFKNKPAIPSEAEGPITRFRLVQGTCPACGAASEFKLYDTVDASDDPTAFSQLLNAALNSLECRCGRSISAVCPLLVHVPESQRIFFLAPAKMPVSDQDAAADQLMKRLRARFQPPPTYLDNLEILEIGEHEYQRLAEHVRKNLQRPLI